MILYSAGVYCISLYITAYMQGTLGISRTNKPTHLTPTIPVTETNICFIIMKQRLVILLIWTMKALKGP
jgi:hypothetical protein